MVLIAVMGKSHNDFTEVRYESDQVVSPLEIYTRNEIECARAPKTPIKI